jgi:hypothetical protein
VAVLISLADVAPARPHLWDAGIRALIDGQQLPEPRLSIHDVKECALLSLRAAGEDHQ